MPKGIDARIAAAIAELGSPELPTPSQPILTLMHNLLCENELQCYAEALNAGAHQGGLNLTYLAARVPSQIRNYLIVRRCIDVTALEAWAADNVGWEDAVKRVLPNPPGFAAMVERIVAEIGETDT